MTSPRPLTETMGVQLIAALVLAVFQTAAVVLAPDANPWPALSPLFAAQVVCIGGAGLALAGLARSRQDDEAATAWTSRLLRPLPRVLIALVILVVAAWSVRDGGSGLTALVWGLVAAQAAFAPWYAWRRLTGAVQQPGVRADAGEDSHA